MSSISSSSNSVAAPIPAKPIPASIQRLIERKVSQVALSRFERFSHWFLMKFSCVCPSYEDSFKDATTKANIAAMMAAVQTTHRFFDGTPLLDRTQGRISSISACDYAIFLQGREVLFSTVGNSQMKITGYNKIEIIVEGIKDQPSCFCIIHREFRPDADPETYWIVDTNKEFIRFQPGSDKEATIYIVEEEIQQGIDLNNFRPKKDESLFDGVGLN